MKKTYAIAFLLLLVSCGTPLEQPMRDFNAYFNSYYNAQKVYREGVEQNLNQSLPINPELPIPVYPAPSRGGAQQFEDAISKGAQILRDHKGTRFESSAIEMIGKSYYYRQEYFSALEKFTELQNLSNGETRQTAIFWKGRVYFHMKAIREGIEFLESEMDLVDDWDQGRRAETAVILAQLYTADDRWREASEQLQAFVPQMEKKKDRDRAYFLLGQVAEQLEDFEVAKEAYSNVRTSNPDYDLVFHAMRKEASVARSLGEYDRAYDLFRSLSRDDKFTEERPDLLYDLGRTSQLMGRSEETAEQYQSLLRDRRMRSTPETKAKTYYGIAELYRYELGDYIMAAAYYDSASMQRVDLEKLPAWYDADEMADSFGSYASIQLEVAELDSLLWLGQLEPAAFDSVIMVIQKRLEEEQRLEQEKLERQQSQSTAVIVDPNDIQDAASAGEFGFLNAQNQRLQSEASLQFRAVWDERPLVDRWRRRSEITGTRNQMAGTGGEASASVGQAAASNDPAAVDSGQAVASNDPATGDSGQTLADDDSSVDSLKNGQSTGENGATKVGQQVENESIAGDTAGAGESKTLVNGNVGEDGASSELADGDGTIPSDATDRPTIEKDDQTSARRPNAPLVDISRVPFTEQEQDSLRKIIDELHYQLANVYFLSLDEPDKAYDYYVQVIENDVHTSLIPKVLYSLTELHILQGEEERALARGTQLLETYPESVFAERIANRLDLEFTPVARDEKTDPREEVNALLSDTVYTGSIRAEAFRTLADSLKNPELQPILYKEAALIYIEEAKKAAPDSLPGATQWFQKQDRWEYEADQFAALKDTVRTVLNDSLPGNLARIDFLRGKLKGVLPDSVEPGRRFDDSVLNTLQQVADSTLIEPEWFVLFPFKGAYWDSARVVLGQFLDTAPSSEEKQQMQLLATSLKVPEDPNAIEPEPAEALPDTSGFSADGLPSDSLNVVKDMVLPDSLLPDASLPDASLPDASLPDASLPESTPDSTSVPAPLTDPESSPVPESSSESESSPVPQPSPLPEPLSDPESSPQSSPEPESESSSEPEPLPDSASEPESESSSESEPLPDSASTNNKNKSDANLQ